MPSQSSKSGPLRDRLRQKAKANLAEQDAAQALEQSKSVGEGASQQEPDLKYGDLWDGEEGEEAAGDDLDLPQAPTTPAALPLQASPSSSGPVIADLPGANNKRRPAGALSDDDDDDKVLKVKKNNSAKRIKPTTTTGGNKTSLGNTFTDLENDDGKMDDMLDLFGDIGLDLQFDNPTLEDGPAAEGQINAGTARQSSVGMDLDELNDFFNADNVEDGSNSYSTSGRGPAKMAKKAAGAPKAARGKAAAKQRPQRQAAINAKNRAAAAKQDDSDDDSDASSEEDSSAEEEADDDDEADADYASASSDSESLDGLFEETSTERAQRKKKRAKTKMDKKWKKERTALIEQRTKEQDSLDRLRTYTKAYKGVLFYFPPPDDMDINDDDGAPTAEDVLKLLQNFAMTFPTEKYNDPDERPVPVVDDGPTSSAASSQSDDDEDSEEDSDVPSKKKRKAQRSKRMSKVRSSPAGEDRVKDLQCREAEDAERISKPAEVSRHCPAHVITYAKGLMTEKQAKEIRKLLINMLGHITADYVVFLSEPKKDNEAEDEEQLIMPKAKGKAGTGPKMKAQFKPIKNLALPDKVTDWCTNKILNASEKNGGGTALFYRCFDGQEPSSKTSELSGDCFLNPEGRKYPIFLPNGRPSLPLLLSAHKSLFGAYEKYFKNKWKRLLKRPDDPNAMPPGGGITTSEGPPTFDVEMTAPTSAAREEGAVGEMKKDDKTSAAQGQQGGDAGKNAGEEINREQGTKEENDWSDGDEGNEKSKPPKPTENPDAQPQKENNDEITKEKPAAAVEAVAQPTSNENKDTTAANNLDYFPDLEYLQKVAYFVNQAYKGNCISATNISVGKLSDKQKKEMKEFQRRGLSVYDGYDLRQMKSVGLERLLESHRDREERDTKVRDAQLREIMDQRLKEMNSFGKRKRLLTSGITSSGNLNQQDNPLSSQVQSFDSFQLQSFDSQLLGPAGGGAGGTDTSRGGGGGPAAQLMDVDHDNQSCGNKQVLDLSNGAGAADNSQSGPGVGAARSGGSGPTSFEAFLNAQAGGGAAAGAAAQEMNQHLQGSTNNTSVLFPLQRQDSSSLAAGKKISRLEILKQKKAAAAATKRPGSAPATQVAPANIPALAAQRSSMDLRSASKPAGAGVVTAKEAEVPPAAVPPARPVEQQLSTTLLPPLEEDDENEKVMNNINVAPPPKNKSTSSVLKRVDTTTSLDGIRNFRQMQADTMREELYRPQLKADDILDQKTADDDELLVLNESQSQQVVGAAHFVDVADVSNKDALKEKIAAAKKMASKIEFIGQDIRGLVAEELNSPSWHDKISRIRMAISAITNPESQMNLNKQLELHLEYKLRHPTPDFETIVTRELVDRLKKAKKSKKKRKASSESKEEGRGGGGGEKKTGSSSSSAANINGGAASSTALRSIKSSTALELAPFDQELHAPDMMGRRKSSLAPILEGDDHDSFVFGAAGNKIKPVGTTANKLIVGTGAASSSSGRLLSGGPPGGVLVGNNSSTTTNKRLSEDKRSNGILNKVRTDSDDQLNKRRADSDLSLGREDDMSLQEDDLEQLILEPKSSRVIAADYRPTPTADFSRIKMPPPKPPMSAGALPVGASSTSRGIILSKQQEVLTTPILASGSSMDLGAPSASASVAIPMGKNLIAADYRPTPTAVLGRPPAAAVQRLGTPGAAASKADGAAGTNKPAAIETDGAAGAALSEGAPAAALETPVGPGESGNRMYSTEESSRSEKLGGRTSMRPPALSMSDDGIPMQFAVGAAGGEEENIANHNNPLTSFSSSAGAASLAEEAAEIKKMKVAAGPAKDSGMLSKLCNVKGRTASGDGINKRSSPEQNPALTSGFGFLLDDEEVAKPKNAKPKAKAGSASSANGNKATLSADLTGADTSSILDALQKPILDPPVAPKAVVAPSASVASSKVKNAVSSTRAGVPEIKTTGAALGSSAQSNVELQVVKNQTAQDLQNKKPPAAAKNNMEVDEEGPAPCAGAAKDMNLDEQQADADDENDEEVDSEAEREEQKRQEEKFVRRMAKLQLKKQREQKLARFRDDQAEESDASESEDGELRLQSDGDDDEDNPKPKKKKKKAVKKKKNAKKKTPAKGPLQDGETNNDDEEDERDDSELDADLDSLINSDSEDSADEDPEARRKFWELTMQLDNREEDSWLDKYAADKKRRREERKQQDFQMFQLEEANDELRRKAKRDKKIRQAQLADEQRKGYDSDDVEVGEGKKKKVRDKREKDERLDAYLVEAQQKAALEQQKKAKERLDKFINKQYEGDLMKQLCAEQDAAAGFKVDDSAGAQSKPAALLHPGKARLAAKQDKARMRQRKKAAGQQVSSDDSEDDLRKFQPQKGRQLGLLGQVKMRPSEGGGGNDRG